MKILHIASFNGNIGDNAHHRGFRKNFEEIVSESVEWTNLEMRKFYKSWNEKKFDDKFANECNNYDLVVIGGGNFFEICHEYSETGCTVDLPKEILKKIKTPIFYNALGFDINKGYTDSTKKKFKNFIDYSLKERNDFVTFRNDGSEENYVKVYGGKDDGIYIVPDGGFFHDTEKGNAEKGNAEKGNAEKGNAEKGKKYIGINLACDMFEKRSENYTYDEFCGLLSQILNKILDENPDYELIFFPHIVTDFKIIYDTLSNMSEKHQKYNTSVIPYITGQGQEKEFFSYYEKCDLITGLRFHTNVCGIALNIPTVGIVSYPKVGALYKDLGRCERALNINEQDFFKKYYSLITSSLNNQDSIKSDYKILNKEIKDRKDIVYKELSNWLKGKKII